MPLNFIQPIISIKNINKSFDESINFGDIIISVKKTAAKEALKGVNKWLDLIRKSSFN